jgi:hypothetical protein
MDPHVRNFLYRNPQHYEAVYPEPGDDTPAMYRRMFARYLPRLPASAARARRQELRESELTGPRLYVAAIR